MAGAQKALAHTKGKQAEYDVDMSGMQQAVSEAGKYAAL
jgi:hypothetical protein